MLTSEQLNDEVVAYRQCKADLETLKKQKEAVEETLRAEMEARNAEEIIVGLFKVTYKEYTRKVFDRQRFIEQEPELYKRYTKTQTYKALSVA